MNCDTECAPASAGRTTYLLSGLLCDATIWSHQLQALAPLTKVCVVSFAGIDDIGAMAEQVLAQAPASFNLVGHSMGARVALEVVRQASARVERLALLDTGVHPVRPGEASERQVLVDLARTQGMPALAARWLPPMLHPDHAADSARMQTLTAMVVRHDPESFAGQVRALLNRPDAEAQLPAITCPVLLGVGREDAWSPLQQHRAMARRIAHARLVVFEHSGHMSPLEAPEAVSAALREWLQAERVHG